MTGSACPLKRLLLAAAVTIGAATTLVSVASGERAAAISIALQGHPGAKVTLASGAKATFVARASVLKGDRIVIVALRAAEKRRVVAICAKSPCTGKWSEKTGVSVRFYAAWIHTSGAADTRSRTIAVTWKKPTPPPPLAQPGHYEGKSSQNELFALDVSADGRSVVNLRTGQINTTCSDGGYTFAGNLDLAGPYAIAADQTFSIAIVNEEIPAQDGTLLKRTIRISGRFAGGVASGSLLVQYDWPRVASVAECSSGNQTWTIPRVG